MNDGARPERKRSARTRSPVSGLEIDVLREAGEWEGGVEETVRRAAERAFVATRGGDAAELCIVLADDELVAKLNKAYRGKDGPTNVLSFPAADMPDTGVPEGAFKRGVPLLGDVVLARETIAREAAAQNKSFENHLSHLTVHGVLHLTGHDHLEDVEADEMEGLERDILEDLGIPDPYGAERGEH